MNILNPPCNPVLPGYSYRKVHGHPNGCQVSCGHFWAKSTEHTTYQENRVQALRLLAEVVRQYAEQTDQKAGEFQRRFDEKA